MKKIVGYETILTISVLSTEPLEYDDLSDIAYEIKQGDMSGNIVDERQRRLTKSEMVRKCKQHNTDPDFFLGEGGKP